MRNYPKPIDDFETIEDEMPNISEFVKDKLHEYYQTGRIREEKA